MKKAYIIITLLISTNLYTQNINKCGTTKLVNEELANNPDYVNGYNAVLEQNKIWLNQNKQKGNHATITLPVVVHIVHKDNHPLNIGTNIPDIQIEDALRILNEDYSKTNPEFPNPPRNTFVNYAGNPNLKFCLATIDPNGNTTNGINRVATTKSNFDKDTESNDMKRSSTLGADGWPPTEYINIWVCDIVNQGGGQILGYAYKPGLPSWNAWKDGLVVDYRYFGTIGNAANNDGRTPTHEIGHYLGLDHTFCEETDAQGNTICCDNDNNNSGGFVDDTPATEEVYYGPVSIITNNNSCNDLSYPNTFTTNVLDMDENYMSYASNTWMFTHSQASVMNATLNGYRANLKNSPVSVNCNQNTNINEYRSQNINIYPNPTSGKITINTNEIIESIYVKNIIGKDVNQYNRNNKNIDLSLLENGVYFINIKTQKGIHIKKLILAK